jgi:hypothetical protein
MDSSLVDEVEDGGIIAALALRFHSPRRAVNRGGYEYD